MALDEQPTYVKVLIIVVFAVIVVLLSYIGYTLFEYNFGETYQYGYVSHDKVQNVEQDARVEEAKQITANPQAASIEPSTSQGITIPTLDVFGTQQHLSVVPSNTKAWLTVDGVDIHDPVMQADNNDFYLTHDELGRRNVWGCYYFTADNNVSDIQHLDKKTLIFGHSNGNSNHYKFSTLKNFKDASFAQENQYVHLTIGGITSKWQIFAAGDIPVEAEEFMEVNPSDEAFKEEVLKMKEYSYSKFDCPVQYGDHIIVLTTCTGGKKYDTRFLVCAKLVA